MAQVVQGSTTVPIPWSSRGALSAMRDESFEGALGVRIFACSWRPQTAPRGIVVISHGFNSHLGQYGWTAERLVQSGFAVYALDHRGRGRSEGERFYLEDFSHYVLDLSKLVQIAKSKEPGVPVFVLGHSAGGVIATTYALEHQSEIAGLICESFAFRVYAPKLALAALKGLSHVAPHAHVFKLPNKEFSRDPEVVDAMNKDPLIAGEVQPLRTVAEMARADERLEREFPNIKLPVLILHGTSDKVTVPKGSQMFYEKAGASDKTLKLYEGHYHDLLNDVGKELVMSDIQAWMDARLRA